MPLYVKWCKNCEKVYEVIIPLKDYDKKVKCPHCKKTLGKIMTPVCFKVN